MDPKQDPYHLLRSCAELLNVPTSIKLEKLDEAYLQVLKETHYEPGSYKKLQDAYVILKSCFETCRVCVGTGSFRFMKCPPCQGTSKIPKEGYKNILKSM